MALTSRDVMFVMRAQDFASRQIRTVGSAFGSLGKQMKAIENTRLESVSRAMQQAERTAGSYTREMGRQQAALTALRNTENDYNRTVGNKSNEIKRNLANNQERLTNAYRTAINPIKAQNDQLRELNATDQKRLRLQSDLTNKQKKQIRDQIAIRREQIAQNRTDLGNRERSHESQMRMLNQQAAGQQRNLAIGKEVFREQTIMNQRGIQQTERMAKLNRDFARFVGQEQVAAHNRAAEAKQADLAAHQALGQRIMMGGIAATIAGTMMATFGTKAVRAFRGAVEGAAEFQKEIALAKTQIDTFDTSVDELTGIVLRAGRAVPAAMEEMPKTLFFIFTSLQANLKDAEMLLKGFSREAVAGNASVEAAARSTIAILNGMGLAFDDLERIQNMQFQTVRKGVITYDELSANIGKVIPPLRRMGQEIEVGGAMIAFLTRQGLSAEMAATSAARSLELFSDPRVVQRLEAQGVTMRNNAGEFADFGVIINSLAEQLDDMTAPERAAAMNDIFGGAGFRIQARRFLDTVFTNLERFNEQLVWARDNANAMSRAFEIMSNEPAAKIQQLANDFRTLSHEIGISLLPVLEFIVEVVRSAVNWFAELDDRTKENITTWLAFASIAFTVVGFLGMAVGIFSILVGLIVQLGAATKTAMLIVGGVPAIIFAIAGAFAWLLTNGEHVLQWLRSINEHFSDTEGKVKLVAVALVLLTGALVAYTAAGNAGIITAAGLTAAFKAKAAAGKGLLTKLGLLNPKILAAVAAFTLVNGIIKVATHSTKMYHEALDRQTDAQLSVIDAVANGEAALRDYNRLSQEAAGNAALQALEERGLADALDKSAVSESRFSAAIAGTQAQREGVINTLQREIAALEEHGNRTTIQGQGITTLSRATRKQIEEKEQLLELMEFEIQVQEDAIFQASRQAREQGGLNRLIASYVDLQGNTSREAELRRDYLEREIISTVDVKNALSELTDEQRRNLFEAENLEEAINELVSAYQQYGEAVAGAFAQIIDPANAFQQALDDLNESAQNSFESVQEAAREAGEEVSDASWEAAESLIEAAGGAEEAASLWLSTLRDQDSESNDLFHNMMAVQRRHADEVGGAADDVITALLEMGEAGPEAMEILASASPEEFEELLHRIRQATALTNSEVTASFSSMLSTVQALQDEFAEVSDEQWVEIMKNMGVVIDVHGPDAIEHMEVVIGAIAAVIDSGEELTSQEMLELMGALLGIAKDHGEEILRYWPEVHTDLSKIIDDGGRLNERSLEGVMGALEKIAKDGGKETVDALSEELRKGTGNVADIVWQYARALANGINPTLESLGKPPISFVASAGRTPNYIGGGPTGDGYGLQEYNLGGEVLGAGPDRDSIIAALTPGEFVLRRRVVDNLDPQALHNLNRTGDPFSLIPKFNQGGFATADDIPKPPTSFAPPIRPLTEPAHATTEHAYNNAREWLKKMIPQLSGGIGWQAMWQAVNNFFGGRVNLHSAFRPGAITATGNPSYHGMGRAIDITPDMGIFNWIKDNYGSQSRELIFSPAGFRQVHNGRPHMYSGITRAMHWDHIHWAMANGGAGRVNEPTWFLAGESGPEDFAFSPAGGSRKAGDGPGIGANLDVLDAFMRNTSFQNATPFRMEGIQTIQSAFSALASYEQAQQALRDAYNEVDRLGKRSVEIASEIEQKELQLSQLAKNRKASAQEELNILQAQRRVREAQWDLDATRRGVHELNNELAVLRQEVRVEEMREAFKVMQEGPGEPEGLQDQINAVKEAQAVYTKSKFEMERIKTQVPYMDDELEILLLQFKAENELADASKALTEEKRKLDDMQQGATYSANELRIAEIELALAEEELLKLHNMRKHEGEALKEAQWQLTVAQEGLTEAIEASKAPTQEMIELEQQLQDLYQEQKDNSAAQIEARNNITNAELAAINATVGLIKAGQELAELAPSQVSFFNQIARQSGVATESINTLNQAIGTLSGAGVQDPRTRLHKEIQDLFAKYKVPLTYGTNESGSARVKRLADEILMGKRTMSDLERSVQIMAAQMQGISLKAVQAGMYDRGGILPPGLTMALNKTGQNEYVFTSDQLSDLVSDKSNQGSNGNTLTIERGAVTITVEGNADQGVAEQIERSLQQVFDDMMMQLRSN